MFSACSGATVEDLYKTHYAGTHPESPPLDPQIDQIAFDIKHHPGDPPARERHVDAAIVSIGINNLGFGPLLEFCIKNDLVTPRIPCQDERVTDVRDSRGAVTAFKGTFSSRAHTLEHELDTLQLDLPAAYAPLAHALSTPLGDSSLGVRPSHVAITQYPDFSRGTDGQLCSGTIGPQSTWQFMELEAGRLNRNVSAAAHAHGWKPVSLDQRVFTGPPGHGYCASPSYFVSLGTAVFGHGNIPSGFHPTLQGHFHHCAGHPPTDLRGPLRQPGLRRRAEVMAQSVTAQSATACWSADPACRPRTRRGCRPPPAPIRAPSRPGR